MRSQVLYQAAQNISSAAHAEVDLLTLNTLHDMTMQPGVRQAMYLLAMMEDSSCNAALAVLSQGQVRVEGCRLMWVFAIPQPRLLLHGPAQLWGWLAAS